MKRYRPSSPVIPQTLPEAQTAFCNSCGYDHNLPREPAFYAAKELMEQLERKKHINLDSEVTLNSRELQTDYLYGKARGKMFGVLVCRASDGSQKILKAFSGQYNGIWEIKGWVPPLFDVQKFYRLNNPIEKQIKALGREAADVTISPGTRDTLLKKRKNLSRQLMKKIHSLYKLNNFKGKECSLVDLFPEGKGIPTGTGDCCAPKLLNFAAIHGLQPLGLAEFYWGGTNKSATRHEGQFYSACKDKCAPILGFLLCGLDAKGETCGS